MRNLLTVIALSAALSGCGVWASFKDSFRSVDTVDKACLVYEANLRTFTELLRERKITTSQARVADQVFETVNPVCTAVPRPSNQDALKLIVENNKILEALL